MNKEQRNRKKACITAGKSFMVLILTMIMTGVSFIWIPGCRVYADASADESYAFLWGEDITIIVGDTFYNSVFNANITSIKCADTSIATVKTYSDDKGRFDITGKKSGKTTITVKTNTKETFKCKVTVKSKSGTKSDQTNIKNTKSTKNYMKNLKGISWDLKTNGKWVSFQTTYAGIGMHTQKVKITKWKVRTEATDVKTLTFRITIDPQWNITNSQIHKMKNSSWCKSTGGVGGNGGYFIIDYDTGENLEVSGNSCGVEVSDTGWHISKTKTYTDNHGCTFRLRTIYTDVTVSYYPGTVLAVGVAGKTSLKATSGDTKFAKGTALFGKTSAYSAKNKKIAHFKRVK